MKWQHIQIQGWIQTMRDKLTWCLSLVTLVGLIMGVAPIAWTADGDLDPSFGAGGKAITDFKGTARAVALQFDEKIVVLGHATGYTPVLVRYHADGTPDTTFGTAGVVKLDAIGCSAMAIQADGKILVTGNIVMSPYSMTTGGTAAAGVSALYNFLDVVVLRYLPDGTPDSTFGSNGTVTTDLAGRQDDYATDIVVQPDGKIVVAGFVDIVRNRDFAVVRYHPDGTLDRSFGTEGIVITDWGSRFDEGWSVAVQSDGKILVAGFTDQKASRYDFAVVRYNSDGTLDPTFGPLGTGMVTTDIANSDRGMTMVLQPDGRIVVAGSSGRHNFAIVRYNPDGIPDTTFGVEGKVTTNIAGINRGFAEAMALQPDGKILVVGYISGPVNSDSAIVRYTSDGNVDTTFGTNGMVKIDVAGIWDMPYGIVLQSDGKIVAVGPASVGTDAYFAVIRYLNNGQ